MTKHLRILAPLLAAAAFAAGCGDGSGPNADNGGYGRDNSAQESTAAPGPADGGAGQATADDAQVAKLVDISGSAFAPQAVDVKVGETVRFVNRDEIAHTATADGTFDSETLEQGASFDFTATEAGKIDYVCVFHPGMTGTINVT